MEYNILYHAFNTAERDINQWDTFMRGNYEQLKSDF